MKQILLFLLLFPCFAMAQYTGNANQKITLGEQTTADGLVYRGVENDTALITPRSDTSAYIILDTVNNKFYNYNRTTNVWSLAGGGVSVTSFSAGTTGLTPSTATTGAVTLGGTLAVANGGTNTGTLTANKVMVGNGTGGVLSPTNLHWDNTNSRLGIGTADVVSKIFIIDEKPLNSINDCQFITLRNNSAVDSNYTTFAFKDAQGNDAAIFGIQQISHLNNSADFVIAPRQYDGNITERMRIANNGNVGIGTASPQSGYRLHVVDSVYVGGNVSASAYTTRSDYELKDEIQNISYGINEVMQMQPVKYTYKSNGSTQLGFIAQDLGVITPEVVSFEDKMSVYYNALIPILTKAIQEQQAFIKALEQRILTLENK